MSRYLAIPSLSTILLCLQVSFAHAHVAYPDTAVKHSTDAVLDDWDPSAFDIHEATGIRMAADNDAEKLYLALYITSQDVQKRMMLGGMQLFIDTKAKKRETTFIEFPVQKTAQEAAQYFAIKNTEAPADALAFREQVAGSMLFFKKTGFKGQQYETELQAINLPGEIILQFGWDERSVMFIEYEIPLSKLGGKEALLHKSVSLGFKLKSIEMSPPSTLPVPIGSETRLIGVPAASSQGMRLNQMGGSTISSSNQRNRQPSSKPSVPELSFWLKHEVY